MFRIHHASGGMIQNGLASGNCREEAICHALSELVERDAWTMAELGAHQLPRQRRSLAFGIKAKDGPDDLEMFPCLDLVSNDLLDKFHQAHLFPVVRDITSSLGVPTIFASVIDDDRPDFPMAHGGLGAHPDVNVALRRAPNRTCAIQMRGYPRSQRGPISSKRWFRGLRIAHSSY